MKMPIAFLVDGKWITVIVPSHFPVAVTAPIVVPLNQNGHPIPCDCTCCGGCHGQA